MSRLALPPSLAERLRESYWRVLVTGASGWLGQAALEILANELGEGWHNRVFAFGSTSCTWHLRDGTRVHQYPLGELPRMPCAPSLLLHFACLTREKTASMPEDAYVRANREISHLAASGGAQTGVERVLLVSSGAVHAAMAQPSERDPSLLYGRLKLADEALFGEFAHAQPGRRTFIARLFNLSGPYINKLDSYALSSFIRQARRGRIEIRAAHPVIRSYTSVENLLGVALGQLLADEAERNLLVETAGEREVEVSELAKRVRACVCPGAIVHRPAFAPMPVDRYVGDGTRYRELMGLYGIQEDSLDQQVQDTSNYLAALGATWRTA